MNINWNQLVKYLSDSKPITGAVFITTLIFVIGAKSDLAFIPKLSSSIYIYCFGLLIFSGSLLAISFVSFIYEKTKKHFESIKRDKFKNSLSPLEEVIVVEFEHVGSEVMHSSRILDKNPNLAKIDILNAVTSLENKDLVKVAYDRNYFWLQK